MDVFADINTNYELDATGDLKLIKDNESIKAAINNLLNTITGFRPGVGNETYGIGVRNYLFSKMTPFVAEQIGDEIYNQLFPGGELDDE